MKHVFSMEAIVHGYHKYQILNWDAPIGENLSCKREVGNIHDTFCSSHYKKDGEGFIAAVVPISAPNFKLLSW